MLTVGNTVLAGAGANGYMFRYTDARPWWNPIPINRAHRLVGQTVSGMASDGTVVVAGTSAGIYRSIDEGLSWKRTDALIPTLPFAILLLYHESTWFALKATPLFASLQKSFDQGQTWESLGVFPIPNVLDIAIAGEMFYLGGEGGLRRAPLSRLLTSVDEKGTTPSVFRLEQNYPNPFNPTTTITYSVDHTNQVLLKVFNVIGKEVATLVDGKQASGRHEVKFDATKLPSGMYFYRLQAGGLTETRRMVLLK
jgi:Secretion system C-terminal sorting domain